MSSPGTFPPGFFERADERDDAEFYSVDRFVAHVDDRALRGISALYDELDVSGDVVDICSSWISHLPRRPRHLTVIGMNSAELASNPMADERIVADLNASPTLPSADASADFVTCAVSVDYLTKPLEVFAEVARTLRPGGLFVCTFSNRCFPTKAIRGWLGTDDRGRCAIVAAYFDATAGFDEPVVQIREPGAVGDPLYAVWATRSTDPTDPGDEGSPPGATGTVGP
ncbi:class I SAM-dependent methyltransferase [Ilumatobacter sp.]|uniref:class I SAM-dependent methyltransferase n=1 Tax=Ilumatobacter sp. TaxID=1967498 RepID=UPI003B521801